MVSLFTSFRLLRLKQYEFHHTVDVDCIKTNKRYCCPQDQYPNEKNSYFLSQCSKCENQGRLQKNIQHVDKFFRSYKCLYMSWNLNQPLILFFSNGAIVSLELNSENNTLLKVEIDETLCGKFLPSRIVDIIFCKNYIYLSYVEPKLTIIQINHDSPNLIGKVLGKKKGKFVGFEPKFFNYDLCIHSPKPAERKLSLNKENNLLLVWWKNSGDDVWPWMPITYLTDRLNLFVYSVNGLEFELLYPVKVQNELFYAAFSKEFPYKFFCLEESKQEDNIVTHISTYEIREGHCQIISTAKLPVSGRLVAFDWSFTEDKLLAADSNGCLLIYDDKSQSSTVDLFNSRYSPLHIAWHPQTCIALIICRNSHILCVDVAFNRIDFRLCYKTSSQSDVDINSFFSSKFTVQKVMWQKSSYNDTCLLFLDPDMSSFLLIKISLGCISRYNISYLELINQYLKSNEFDKAKLLFLKIEWAFHPDLKFQCLSKMINYLLRRPLDLVVQYNLENMLGSFYRCIDYIPRKVVKNFEPKMYHLSRRFFHCLLRYNKFEKAWSLAVDLDSQDLFLDLYRIALQNNQSILAAVALRKAELYDSSDSCSESCESGTCSESGSSSAVEYHDGKFEKQTSYRKMYQDIIDRIPDSCEEVESDNQQTKKINEAFEKLKFHKNKMLYNKPYSSSFKPAGFISENVCDTDPKLLNPSFTHKDRSLSKRSLVDMPSNKYFEGSCFSRHLKYATTPISNKDYNMLHHKSTQVPFYGIRKPNNLRDSNSIEPAPNNCFEKNTSNPVSSIIFDTGVDAENYYISKCVTKDSVGFSPLLMQNSPNTAMHSKDSRSSFPNNDSISSESLMFANSDPFISFPVQTYETETASDLPLHHLCDRHSNIVGFDRDTSHTKYSSFLHPESSTETTFETKGPIKCSGSREYSTCSNDKKSRSLITATRIDPASNSKCLHVISSPSDVINDSDSPSSLHSSLKNCNSLGSKEYINYSSHTETFEDQSSIVTEPCKIVSPFKKCEDFESVSCIPDIFQKSHSTVVFRTLSENNSENTVPVTDFSKDVGYGNSQSQHSFYDKCDSTNERKGHNILTKSESCLNTHISSVASSNWQEVENTCAALRNTLDQSYKLFSSSTCTNDTKYVSTFQHNLQNISVKPSVYTSPSSIKSHVNFDLNHPSSLVCDKHNSFKGKDNERYVADEESEEMEGTRIKLDHLGII